MIYHPGSDRGEPAQSGVAEMIPVPVRTEDGLVVTGWYAPPTQPQSVTIALFHGNAGTIAHRAHKARMLLDAGYGVFLVGYRGYGGNPGRPSEAGLYSDARAALAWLQARGVPENRLVAYGESLGTGIAVQMMTEHPSLAALVLEAPFTSLPNLAPPYLMPGFADMLMVDRYDSLSKITANPAPLLILHGEHDGVVPVSMGRQMFAAASGEKEGAFLSRAGHNDLWDHGGGERVVEFLIKHT
ncbi:MAG: alpha/beta hydrolase [Magnetospirillum sp.]|nr:alpha/beta hydrolase [Magnetospirillum sp.]